MSAPDPKAWALTEADWERMVDTYGYWNSELPDVIQSVARRRAIEELRALAFQICESCSELEPRVMCKCGCNRMRHSSGLDCYAAEMHDRIAAIEAEEPTPASPA